MYIHPYRRIIKMLLFQTLRAAPRHPRPVSWMPDGPNEPPDAPIHIPNSKNGPKRHWFRYRSPSFVGAPALGVPII